MLRNRVLEKIGSAKSIVLLSSALTVMCYSNHAVAQSSIQDRCHQECSERNERISELNERIEAANAAALPGQPKRKKLKLQIDICIERCISTGQPGVPAPTTPTGAPVPTDNPACRRYPNLC